MKLILSELVIFIRPLLGLGKRIAELENITWSMLVVIGVEMYKKEPSPPVPRNYTARQMP
jgi:hypothetical protein